MKTIVIIIIGLLMLRVTASSAEDKKPGTIKETLSAPLAPEKAARVTFQSEAANEIALKRITLKGPLIALAKSDSRWQTFNPFRPAKNGAEPEDFKIDPYVGRPR